MKEKIKKYLPSKKFTIVMGVILGILIIVFSSFYIFSGKVSFTGGNTETPLSIESRTPNDFINRDTDGDTVPDWKEALWKTDKNNRTTYEGIPDATYIAERKRELNIEPENIAEEEYLTETEKFAREFFTTFTAMKASGEVDAEMINDFSTSLGQSVVEAELTNVYTEKEALISENDTPASRKTYYESIKSIFDEHRQDGLGSELAIVSGVLAKSEGTGGNKEDYRELLVIGEGYKAFAKEMIGVEVPKSLLGYHLIIANSANNTGSAVLNLEKIVDDPVMGIAGLAQYKKYSDELLAIVTVLEEALAKE